MNRPAWAALAGLLFGGITTVLLWVYTDRLARRSLEEGFVQRASHATLAVDRSLDELTGALQTIRSLVEASGRLDRETFERALRSRNQRMFYTGLQYIGLAFVKPDEGAACEGPTEPLPCLVLDYVYPLATNEALPGSNLFEGAARMAAIRRAIDTGYVAVTEPLAFAPDSIAAPGLIAYLPIYRRTESLASVDARRRALAAVTLVSFSLEGIVRAELGGDFFRSLRFRVLDRGLAGRLKRETSDTSAVVLDGPALLRGGTAHEGDVFIERRFDRGFAGREWTYLFEMPPPTPTDASVAAPRLTVVLGGLSTLLLAVFLQFVSNARSRAEALAGEMTRHLQQSESQLRLALDAAQMGAWSWDGGGGGFSGDARASRLLPMGGRELTDVFAAFAEEDVRRAHLAVERALRGDGIVSIEGRLKGDSGRWLELVAHVRRGPETRPERAVGLVRDISERIRQASARRLLLNKLVTAEEQERRRIARELHDQLGQEITAISLGLKHLEGLEAEPAARLELLSRLRTLVQSIDERVDRFMLDLRPVMLDDLGLEAALRAHFEQWSEVHGIQVHSHITGLRERDLPFEITTTTFRLVQESLTNVARHAQASAVDVIVEWVDSGLRVVIEDNGRGVDGAIDSRRQGLAGMRERVESLGGEFRYESSAGQGFSVFARIPLSEAAEEGA